MNSVQSHIEIKSKTWLYLCLLLAIALYSVKPLLLHLFTCLPDYHLPGTGSARNDPMMFCWNFWWIKGWITGQHDLLFTRHLHHPFGISLSQHTLSPANGFLAILISSFTGFVGAHNLLLIMHVFLTGAGTFLLTRSLHCNNPASLVAGVIAMLWPARIIHTAAHVNISGTAWIPLALWMLILTHKKRRYVLLSGLLLFMTGATSWYHLLSLILIAWVVFPRYGSKNYKSKYLRLFTAYMIGILMLCPLIIPMFQYTDDIPERSREEKISYSIPIKSFVSPPPGYPVWDIFRSQSVSFLKTDIETTGYIGVIPFLLLFWGLIKGSSETKKWMWAAVLLSIFSMGPILSIGRFQLPLPYQILEKIPGFAFGRTPGRLMITAGIALAVGAGLVLSGMIQNRKKHGWIMMMVPALVLLDFCPPALPINPIEIPDIYKSLPDTSPDRPAVLEIPADWSIREYQFYQTIHNRPISSGFVSRIPSSIFYRIAELPYFSALSDPAQVCKTLHHADPVKLRDLVSILKAGTVIIHRNLIQGDIGNVEEIAAGWNADIWQDDGKRLVLKINNNVSVEGESSRIYFVDKWFPPERWENISTDIRWINGLSSKCLIFISEDIRSLEFSFMIFPARQQNDAQQKFDLVFNDRAVKRNIALAPSQWAPIKCNLPGPFDPDGNRLVFRLKYATAPKTLADSTNLDSRQLSAAVTACTFAKE